MGEKSIVGIDIGSEKISVLIAKVSEKEDQPRVMGFATLASSGVKKGQIVDIGKTIQVLEEVIDRAERMSGTGVSKAFVSVGGPIISSLNSQGVVAVSQPEVEITQNDVERVIEAAKAISLSSTKQVIAVIPREFTVDGQAGIKNPLGMTGVRLEVSTHIITALSTTLKNLERCLSELGIKCEDFVFSGMASGLSTLTDTEKELGVVLVDLGGGKTDIAIYVEGSLSFSSSIPIGARHITNDIAVGLRVSLESAEKVKLYLSEVEKKEKIGKSGKKDEVDISSLNLPEGISTISFKTVVEGIIRPRVEEIFEKVLSEIEKSGFISMIPSGLVITGGGALTVGLLPIARKVTELPSRIGIPKGVVGLVDEILEPAYSTLIGLILYGKNFYENEEKTSFGDFSRFFQQISVSSSFKKVIDFFKSFFP